MKAVTAKAFPIKIIADMHPAMLAFANKWGPVLRMTGSQTKHTDWPTKAVEQKPTTAVCLDCNTTWRDENLAYARQHVKEKKHYVCFESDTVKAS